METRFLFKVLARPTAGALCAGSLLVMAPVLAQQPDQQLKDQEGRQIVVEEGTPHVTVDQSKTRVNAKEGSTDVQVKTGEPKVSVEQGEPEVSVAQPTPEVRVQQAEPNVVIRDAQPQVEVNQDKPQVRIIESEPEVEIVERDQAQPGQQQAQGESRLMQMKVSEVQGMAVQTQEGKNVGQVEDIVVNRNTRAPGLVVSGEDTSNKKVFIPTEEVQLQGDALVWQAPQPQQSIDQSQYNEQDYVSVID